MKYILLLSLFAFGSSLLQAQITESFLKLLPEKPKQTKSIVGEEGVVFFTTDEKLTCWRVEGDYWLLKSNLPFIRTGIYLMDTTVQKFEEQIPTFDPETFEEMIELVKTQFRALAFIRPWPQPQDAARSASGAIKPEAKRFLDHLSVFTRGSGLEVITVDGQVLGASVTTKEGKTQGYYCRTAQDRYHYHEPHPWQKGKPTKQGYELNMGYHWNGSEWKLDGCWSLDSRNGGLYKHEIKYFVDGKQQGLYYFEEPRNTPFDESYERKLAYYEKGKVKIDFQLLGLEKKDFPAFQKRLSGKWNLYAMPVCDIGTAYTNHGQGHPVLWTNEKLEQEGRPETLLLDEAGTFSYTTAEGQTQKGRWRLISAFIGEFSFDGTQYLLLEMGEERMAFILGWESKVSERFIFIRVPVPEGL